MSYYEVDSSFPVGSPIMNSTIIKGAMYVDAALDPTAPDLTVVGKQANIIAATYMPLASTEMSASLRNLFTVAPFFEPQAPNMDTTVRGSISSDGFFKLPHLIMNVDTPILYNVISSSELHILSSDYIGRVVYVTEDENVRVRALGLDQGYAVKDSHAVVEAYFYDINGRLGDPEEVLLKLKKPGEEPTDLVYTEGETSSFDPGFDTIFKVDEGVYGVKVNINKISHWYFDWKAEGFIEGQSRLVLRTYKK